MSAIMGNVDDAVSITVAVLIVLTGTSLNASDNLILSSYYAV